MKTVMVRNGGGNTASLRRSKLTDVYMSPEGLEDIRNWGLDQVDELTRREIFMAADGTITWACSEPVEVLCGRGKEAEFSGMENRWI